MDPLSSVAELRAAARQIPAALAMGHPSARDVPFVRPSTFKERTRPLVENILDASGVRSSQRALVGSVLDLLDDACLRKLKTFSVLYDNPQHRGLAGKGVILVSGNVPDRELVGLLLHEGLGHYRDITCLTGTPQSGASAFKDGGDPIWNDDPSVSFYALSWESEKIRRADARREDFVTGYAYEGDNFEDLAESITYYNTHEQTFRLRAKSNPILAQKLAWLETHMPKTAPIASTEDSAWDGTIAWDATKLSFHWASE